MPRELLHKRISLDFSHQGHATVKALGNDGDFPLPPGMPNVLVEIHGQRMRITEHEAQRLGEALISAASAVAAERNGLSGRAA